MQLYDERDDFPFPIVNSNPSDCARYSGFLDSAQLLTKKQLKPGFAVSRLKKLLENS
jgi:hypothetical protein